MLVQQLSTGKFHSCGVSENRAYCWGWNRHGALGDGTFTRRLTPVAVAGGLSFSGVSAGNEYNCGVTSEKLAYCWGYNNNGGLGDGTTTLRLTPVAASGGLHFGSVNTSLVGHSTCGVTTGERAYCWGNNFLGQLGDGTYATDRLTSVAVVGRRVQATALCPQPPVGCGRAGEHLPPEASRGPQHPRRIAGAARGVGTPYAAVVAAQRG